MMPSAFLIMPFKEPYESIYIKIFNPVLSSLGFTVVRADSIKQCTPIIEDIENSIKRADLIVIEVTEQNPNVYWEFGYAKSQRKEIIVLTQDISTIPFDSRHIRHLKYSASKLVELKNEFSNWVKETRCYSIRDTDKPTKTLVRGETFDDFFDSVSYVETSSQSVEQQIMSAIKRGSMIPCFYSYKTDKGALHWLKLSSDPLYKVFLESIEFLQTNGKALLQSMGEKFINSSPDYISLGPGNGQKDRVLMHALREEQDTNANEMFYYPVDISRRMLGAAVRCLLSDQRLKDTIKVKAINAEFSRLSDYRPVFDYRHEPNIFLLLGNTLGNLQDEVTFLHTLKNVMHDDDILLLEVRRRTTSLVLGGDDEDQIGLSFSPLASLGVVFETDKVYKVEEDTISQIRRTQTIATRYHDAVISGDKYTNILLSCVNFYDPHSLQETLCGKSLNFHLLHYSDTALLSYFVLKRS